MSRTPRLPTLFVSHGAPSFALDPGLAGPRLTALGASLSRPKAVLVVSPHFAESILHQLADLGHEAWPIGRVDAAEATAERVVVR